jgi:uncharacterized iron-regulated protein
MTTLARRRVAAIVAGLLLLAAAPLPEWQSPLGRDHPLIGTIWDMRANTAISPETLIARLGARRYVLLGEKHDNADHHRLQAWVLGELIAAGRRPAVAFEMFRADQAPAIARHLAASPGDARGLGDAIDWQRSGWPPWSMYESIADVALRAKLPLVAANPSAAATSTLRRGGVAALDPTEVTRLGLDRALPEDDRERLATQIRDGHCGHLPERAIDPFIVVQRARDGHMAAALREAGGDGAVLIAGTGHVRRDLGVPRLLPEGESATVAFVEVRPSMTTAPAIAVDYVWLTPRTDDRDPCERFRKELERLNR